MSELARRNYQVPARRSGPLDALVVQVEDSGVAAITSLQVGAVVTSVAMQSAQMLSGMADAASQRSPAGRDVYKRILMAYGVLATAEIEALGGKEGRWP
jgi:hypothetical protein